MRSSPQSTAWWVFLDSLIAPSCPRLSRASTSSRPASKKDLIFNCQTAWARVIARILFGAGYAVVSFCPPQRRGRWRARWRNHCSFCAALPLERRGRLMARHRGRLPYSAGPRFTGAVPLSPPAFAFWAKRTAGGRPPVAMLLAGGSYWPPGGAPGAARVREERPLPAAGAASGPTRMTPHESALWRTERH